MIKRIELKHQSEKTTVAEFSNQMGRAILRGLAQEAFVSQEE